MNKLFCVCALLLVPGFAVATPGGVDRYGCHNSKAIGYHCHGVKLAKIVHTYQGESAAQRSKRLQAQCRGLENAGVCFGYSDQR